MDPAPNPDYKVFISHAEEDKATIAIPLREKLLSQGITTFVDELDVSAGEEASIAITSAMKKAEIAIFVLSPEFVARKQSMKELMYFLRRSKETCTERPHGPVLMPFFYRLSTSEICDEPRLDRWDKDGRSLYHTSRFLERMSNGEPEANIGLIQAALEELRQIIGIRNDVDATNDSTHLMSVRRGILLDKLCERGAEIISSERKEVVQIEPDTREEHDAFRPHFDVPYKQSELVLDFDSIDARGEMLTQEGRLMKMVLSQSTDENTMIAIRGIGGVGKTSLVRGLMGLDQVKKQFKDGIYYMSLGMDATDHNVMKSIVGLIRKSGGRSQAEKLAHEKDLEEIMSVFRSWFAVRQCLFVVDDVWESEKLSSSVIDELLTLNQGGRGAKLLLTTRSLPIASRTEAVLGLEPREALGSQARAILIRYSGIPVANHSSAESIAMTEILNKCSGLPLFLAVAGRGVKMLSFRKGSKRDQSYQVYASILTANLESFPNTYERLHETLTVSIKLLEERMKNLGFEVPRTAAEMHRRLSVIEIQEKVPMTMLRHLWELGSQAEAAIVAREFEQMAIAEIEIDEEDQRGCKQVLNLHDSIHYFALNEARKRNETKSAHNALLRGYSDGLEVTQGCRTWWSGDLKADGYIHEHLCRHLFGGGRCNEAIQLQFHPEWTARMFSVSGIGQMEKDFALCISELRNLRARSKKDVSLEAGAAEEPNVYFGNDTIKAMELLSVAVSSAGRYIAYNVNELCFQLYGRLHRYSERFEEIGGYLDLAEGTSAKPWLRSLNSFLPPPILASKGTISLGPPVECMTMMSDGEFVWCGLQDGRIGAVNTTRRALERISNNRMAPICNLAIGRGRTRIVAASADRSVSVWDAETLRCLERCAIPCTVFYCNMPMVPLAVIADDKRAVSAVYGRAKVWEMDKTLGVLQEFHGHEKRISCMAAFNDGETVVSGGEDETLRLWNATSGTQLGEPFIGHQSSVTCVAITPDGRKLVSGSLDGTTRVWDVESHTQIGDTLMGAANIRCVAVSQDGNHIASVSEMGNCMIHLWYAGPVDEVCELLRGHTSTVTGISFLAVEKSLVSCSLDGTLRIWEVGLENEEVVDGKIGLNTVSFTPDGEYIVSGLSDGTLRIWDATSGRQVGDALRGHTASVEDIAVAPDGLRAVSASSDMTVRVWDLQSRKLLHTFLGHTGRVSCVAVSPNGKYAISGSDDRSMRLWDLDTLDNFDGFFIAKHCVTTRVFFSDEELNVISVECPWAEPLRLLAPYVLEEHICFWDKSRLPFGAKIDAVHSHWPSRSEVCIDASRLSRREALLRINEQTANDDAGLSVKLGSDQIRYSDGPDAQVLATMDSPIMDWALSPDRMKVCAVLHNGKIAIMRLEK